MQHTSLEPPVLTRSISKAFGGYHHSYRIGDGEFFDTENTSAAEYPLLATRKKRGKYLSPASAQGIAAKDALCYVDGNTLYIGEYPVPGLVLSTEAEDCPKTLVSMGAYLLIFPDRKYVNRENLEDTGSIDAEFFFTPSQNASLSFSPCDIEGKEIHVTAGPAEPSDPQKEPYWLDTSVSPPVLYAYSTSLQSWTAMQTTYVKMSYPDIDQHFDQYDGVQIRGLADARLFELNAANVVWGKGDGYLVLSGILGENIIISGGDEISIERRMPEFDFVTESGNRLWACRYGKAQNGDIVNEIYASKLGDFKNWNCFMGISTDSYAASVGTDGAFTGATTHLGYPIFFKENCLHKVYGEMPSNFQIQNTVCRGVQKGSGKSLATVNGVLYYKSRFSVMSYDGSLPQDLPDVFGDVFYRDAVGGSHGNLYYISMRDADGIWNMFVYDAAKGIWHREDNTHASGFCSLDGDLYFINADDGSIMTTTGRGEKETDFPFSVTSGLIGTDVPEKKYLSRLVIRMSLKEGAYVSISVEYDSSGVWEPLREIFYSGLYGFSVAVYPKRCDHLRLRLDGVGDMKLFSLTKYMEEGSDSE